MGSIFSLAGIQYHWNELLPLGDWFERRRLLPLRKVLEHIGKYVWFETDTGNGTDVGADSDSFDPLTLIVILLRRDHWKTGFLSLIVFPDLVVVVARANIFTPILPIFFTHRLNFPTHTHVLARPFCPVPLVLGFARANSLALFLPFILALGLGFDPRKHSWTYILPISLKVLLVLTHKKTSLSLFCPHLFC